MKTKSKRAQEIDDALKFVHDFRKWRWEFLRLNEKYQKDYDAIATRLPKLHADDNDVRAFSEKWLILPHDYRNNTPPVSMDLNYEPISFCSSGSPFVIENCSLPVTLISSRPLRLKKIKSARAPISADSIPEDVAEYVGIKINTAFPRDVIVSIVARFLEENERRRERIFSEKLNIDYTKIRIRMADYASLLGDFKLYKKYERYVATLKKSKKSAYSMAASKKYGENTKATESNYKLFYKRIQKCNSLIERGIRSIHPSQFLT